MPMSGTSLVVQWLRLCAASAGGLGSIPGQGTRSHMPQLSATKLKKKKWKKKKKKPHQAVIQVTEKSGRMQQWGVTLER